jgi:Ca-activated chloride channel family protein
MNTPDPNRFTHRQPVMLAPSGRSIRRRLEEDAWRRLPDFARAQARRRLQAERRPHPAEPPQRSGTLRWLHARATAFRRRFFACGETAPPPSPALRRSAVASFPAGKSQPLRCLRWQDLALLAIWIVLTSLLVLRFSSAEAAPAGADGEFGLEFRGDGQSVRSVALDTDIAVDVTGMVARIDVRQKFRNGGRAWVEAVYRFPLPPGAAVDRLKVDAAGRVLEGEIREKQTAQRQYQLARADGLVAALVEQQRANQFETRLANIGPDEDITVSISFLAHVAYREGNFSLQIPLTFTPRWDSTEPARVQTAYAEPAPAPAIQALDGLDDHRLTIGIRLRSGLSLARLESRYHDMDIHPALGGYDLFLTDPDTRTDRVFELNWAPDLGHEPESALMTWDGGDAVYALLMLAPPLPEAVAPQPREVVFVIDTSGSMEGQSLHQARAALYQGLDRLGPDDRFNLVRFDSDSERLFERSVPADDTHLLTAMDFIDDLSASGGTNMAPALRDAMSLPPLPGLMRQIVFITDGSVGNEEDLLLQIGEELGASSLFTVAIGSAPNAGFMRKAAEIGRGNHTHIGRLDEVAERMAALWARIENPALQDICVDWGADAEYYPEIIPDLYAGEPLWLLARLPLEPREIRLCGNLNGQPWEQLRRPAPGRGSENLATLWARSKIEALEDSRVFGADANFVREEVTGLALRFGLLTAYTSLVAVDHSPARPTATGLHGEDVPSLLPAGSTLSTAGFATTATAWPLQLLFALITLFIAAGLLWFSSPSRQVRAGGVLRPCAGKPVTPGRAG